MSALPINALAALGNGAQITPVSGLGSASSLLASTPSGQSGSGFGDALAQAVSSLQQTQDTAATAATQLATGQTTDPTTAVTDVENAQLAMELASTITQKATTSLQTIFQTQV